jgi:hypothetical protein
MNVQLMNAQRSNQASAAQNNAVEGGENKVVAGKIKARIPTAPRAASAHRAEGGEVLMNGEKV